MPAVDDDHAGWRLISWLARRASNVAPEAPAATTAAAGAAPPSLDLGLLGAVVSGLPDPVVVLDADGRVLAFNADASALAPALRPGEPALIALRTPDTLISLPLSGA